MESKIVRKKQLNDTQRSSICKKYDMGRNASKIALDLDLNLQTVVSVINKYKKTGCSEAVKKRKPKIKIIDDNTKNYIKQKIDEDVSITLVRLKSLLREDKGIVASLSTINNAIKDFNYSFKRIELIPAARNNEKTINLRQAYCETYALWDEDSLIFVDEFGISCSTRVKYGRSEKGTTPRKSVRTIRSKNISVSAAIMKNKVITFKIQDRPYTGESFFEFINNLCATLINTQITSAKIIMDNASIHKGERVRELLEQKGFQLVFLPAYSPQLNPIEEVFGKWKHLIKIENCSTIEDLMSKILSTASCITRSDCNAFFSHVREFILKGIRKENF